MEEIWEAFQNGKDFSERAERFGETSVPEPETEPETEPEPALSVEEVDRLVLTVANYFGIETDKVTNSKLTGEEAVTARLIAFSLLENEYGLSRKEIAAHFGRTKNSLNMTLKNQRNRQRLLDAHRAITAIAEGFKANDMFEKQAERIRKEREAEAARANKYLQPSAPRPERVVPQEELELFKSVRDGDTAAVRKVSRRYLKDVGKAMADRAAELGIGLPERLPRESLHKTARNFYFVADRHEDFLGWAERVARKDVDLLAERLRREEVARTIDVPAFFSETYEAYRSIYGKGQWNQASGELLWMDHESLKESAKDVFDDYRAGHPAGVATFVGFKRLIEHLYKTNVLLRDPEKGTGHVAEDSLARQAVITEFPPARSKDILRLALKSFARDGAPKRK